MKKYRLSSILFFFIFLSLISFMAFSCSNSSEPAYVPEPGRRDYIWTVDTIPSSDVFQLNLTAIWGSSPQNVWIGGFNSNNNNVVYHFDGQEWSPIKNLPETFYPKQVYAIKGTGSEIYFFGMVIAQMNVPPYKRYDSCLVIKYSNSNFSLITPEKGHGLIAADIIDNQNIWCGGNEGTLFRYNGFKWEDFDLKNTNWLINKICALTNEDVYFVAVQKPIVNGNEYYEAIYLLNYNGNAVSIIDSNINSNNYQRRSFPPTLTKVGNELWGSGDNGIVKRNGNNWDVVNSSLTGRLKGTNSNNIFLLNLKLGCFHFNGKDWHYFEDVPIMNYYDICVFNDHVFIVCSNGFKSYVIRGVLK